METIKLFALFFLVIFFSTNYYGGNSLYFFTSEVQYILKIISGTTGFILLFVYFVLKNKNEREIFEKNGLRYTKEALKNMEENNITMESVETTISNGNRKQKHKNTYYTKKTEEGVFITVVQNKQGHILNIM